LPEYQTLLVDYIAKIFDTVIYRKTKEEVFCEQKEENERRKKEAEEKEELQKEAVMLETEVDELTRLLYNDVKIQNRQTQHGEDISSSSNEENYIRAKRKTLYETIQDQVITYVKYCSDMNMMLVLEQYGNEAYTKDQEKNQINKSEITKYGDPVYVAKYFDLLLWWKEAGPKSFLEISCAALVMLGIPEKGIQSRNLQR
jgi:hypothetical protein